jgi:glutamyl-tRNA reductase
MLPPQIRAIVSQIEKAIETTNGRADKRNQRSDEQQEAIANSIKSLTDELRSHNAKQESAEPIKRGRENWTLGSLIAAAAFTLILAGMSACQLREMQRVYGPIEKSAVAAQDTVIEAKKQTEIAVQGNRPYILFDLVPPNFPSNLNVVDRPTVDKLTVTFKFTNYGKSPAVGGELATLA